MQMTDTNNFVKAGFVKNGREWENKRSSVKLRGGKWRMQNTTLSSSKLHSNLVSLAVSLLSAKGITYQGCWFIAFSPDKMYDVFMILFIHLFIYVYIYPTNNYQCTAISSIEMDK